MSQKTGRKGRRGVAVYELNPFLEALVSAGTELQEVGFVRLYPHGVRALRGLSSAGAKVFGWLCNEIQKAPRYNKVRMSFGLVDQATHPMSRSTYMRGMKELVDHDFLAAATSLGWFWFNPHYVAKPAKVSGE